MKSEKIKKDDFIEYLAKATPEELNQLIIEKGKPRRMVDPIFYFNKYDKEENK